jgi:hypothetical protein
MVIDGKRRGSRVADERYNGGSRDRRYWGEGEELQKAFDAAAHWLLTDRRSPWRHLDWGAEPER